MGRRRPGAAIAVLARQDLVDEGDDSRPRSSSPSNGTRASPDHPRAAAEPRIKRAARGVALTLDIHGLEPAPDGSHYQGWVRSDDGETVTVGTFHMRSATRP